MNSKAEYELVETEIPLVEIVEHPWGSSSLLKRVEEIEELMECGLMYVETRINHRAARNTIVVSEATHNFMTETEAKRLNIL